MKRLIFAVLALAATPALAAADGAALYSRCSACHLPTGKGVPGAFPGFGADFVKLSGTAPGRRYLLVTSAFHMPRSVILLAETFSISTPE